MKKVDVDFYKILFLLGTFLIEFALFTQNISFFANSTTYLMRLGLIVLAIDTFFTLFSLKISYKNWLLILILFTVAFFSFLITKNNILIMLFLFLIPAIKFKFSDIVKWDLIFKVLLGIFIYLCYSRGYALVNVFIRFGELRYSFGFKHPNTFGYYILMLFMEFTYLRFNKFNKMNLICLIALAFISFYLIEFSSSRTSEFCLIIFVLLYIIMYIKYKFFNKRMINKLLYFLFPFFTILSILLVVLFSKGNSVAYNIDSLLTGRIKLFSYYWSNYPITLLGNNVNYIDTLDNIYVMLLVNFGIVGWILYLYIYNRIFKSAANNNDNIMIIIYIVFLIYGFMEWYTIRPVINIFLIYFMTSLLNGGKHDED